MEQPPANAPQWSGDKSDFLFQDAFIGEDTKLDSVDVARVFDNVSRDSVAVHVASSLVDSLLVIP